MLATANDYSNVIADLKERLHGVNVAIEALESLRGCREGKGVDPPAAGAGASVTFRRVEVGDLRCMTLDDVGRLAAEDVVAALPPQADKTKLSDSDVACNEPLQKSDSGLDSGQFDSVRNFRSEQR